MRSPTWGKRPAFGVVKHTIWKTGKKKDKERLMENNMTLDLDNMTRSEFDKLMTKIKDRNPNLFQFIIDFLDDKVTPEEVYDFLKMKHSYQVNYIKNYQARA